MSPCCSQTITDRKLVQGPPRQPLPEDSTVWKHEGEGGQPPWFPELSREEGSVSPGLLSCHFPLLRASWCLSLVASLAWGMRGRSEALLPPRCPWGPTIPAPSLWHLTHFGAIHSPACQRLHPNTCTAVLFLERSWSSQSFSKLWLSRGSTLRVLASSFPTLPAQHHPHRALSLCRAPRLPRF